MWGSITVMLVSQVLCLFLEATRREELKKIQVIELQQNMESVFSAYQCPMWERYQILGWDETRVPYDDILRMKASDRGVSLKSDLLRTGISKDYKMKRTLLTDQEGLAYKAAVVAYMKENCVYEAIDKILSNSDEIVKLEEVSGGSMDYYLKPVEDSQNKIKEWNKEKNSGGGHTIAFRQVKAASEKSESTIEFEGPFNMMTSIMQNGILGTVIMNQSVSRNDIGGDSRITRRELEMGDYKIQQSFDLIDRVYFLSYLYSRFGYYGNSSEDSAMEYEWEYLLNGLAKDYQNLEATAARLMIIRMAANVTSLCQDSVKVNEAEAYGMLLASLILMPELSESFKWAIICSWAFAESLLDLRSLFHGDEIPLIKSAEEWTIQEYLLSELYIYGGSYAKACEEGLSYENYVQAMLVTVSDRNLSKRAMELQEKTIQQIDGYEDFKMDHLVISCKVEGVYEVQPVFLPLVTMLGGSRKKSYSLANQSSYSYVK